VWLVQLIFALFLQSVIPWCSGRLRQWDAGWFSDL
jgi:hypothetical protein